MFESGLSSATMDPGAQTQIIMSVLQVPLPAKPSHSPSMFFPLMSLSFLLFLHVYLLICGFLRARGDPSTELPDIPGSSQLVTHSTGGATKHALLKKKKAGKSSSSAGTTRTDGDNVSRDRLSRLIVNC